MTQYRSRALLALVLACFSGCSLGGTETAGVEAFQSADEGDQQAALAGVFEHLELEVTIEPRNAPSFVTDGRSLGGRTASWPDRTAVYDHLDHVQAGLAELGFETVNLDCREDFLDEVWRATFLHDNGTAIFAIFSEREGIWNVRYQEDGTPFAYEDVIKDSWQVRPCIRT